MLIVPGPVWSVALVGCVLGAAGLTVVLRWGCAVLGDADRYVAATSHLPESDGVRRLSGWVSARAVRRAARRRGLAGLPGRGAVERTVARAVPALMARPSFRSGWSITHRILHAQAVHARRGTLRRVGLRVPAGRGPVRSRPVLVAMVMLLLAAGGEVVARVPRRAR